MIAIKADQRPRHLNEESIRNDALPPFVGREREFGELRDKVERMLAGRGQLVLLSGEPGIGKTRVAEEMFADSSRRDMQVFWGRCYEWEGAPAFWPWIQIIRDYLHNSNPEATRRQMGAGAADIAQIVPEVRDHVPDHPPLPDLEPEESRFRLFDAVTSLFRNRAHEQPLFIVLDDIHRADTPSLMLLHFLAQEIRESRVFVLATYRPADVGPTHPLSSILSELSREPTSTRITLTGLRRDAVDHFVTLTIGNESQPALVDAIFRETEGNPFFMTEVIRLLASEGVFDQASHPRSWRIQVPESVREVIGRRLNRLSPACHQMLAVASVIGRDFGIAPLELATAMKRIQLLELLDEAITAHVIQEDGPLGHYRFRHVLIQEVLYRQLTTSRRVQFHQAVGEALEQVHASNLAPHYTELAHHFLQTAPAGDLDRAIGYAIRAGDRAMEQVAWESAEKHYRQALEAFDLQSGNDRTQYCELLLALGDAQNRIGAGSGDAPEARETFLQAVEVARSLGSATHFARGALGYAGFNAVATFGELQQVRMLEEALEMIGDDDSKQKIHVLSRLALDLANVAERSNVERVRALGDEAVEIARRLGDPVSLAFALGARHFSGWGPDNLDDRLTDAAELVALVETTGDLLSTAWAYIIQLEDLVESGDLDKARQAMEAFTLTGEKFRVPYISLRVVVYRAMMLLMAGRFEEAEPLVQQGGELWQSTATWQHQSQVFTLRREQGRLEELVELVETANEHPATRVARYSHLAAAHLPVLYLETGRTEKAREQFEAMAANHFADVPFDLSWLSLLSLLAEACVQLEDTRRAEVLYDLLLPYANQNALLAISAVCHGSVAYYLGLLATALERWPAADRHFDQAQAMHQRMEMHPYIAHTLHARAKMLDQRGQPEDVDQALQLAQRARSEAVRLKMSRLENLATDLIEKLSSIRRLEPGLTPRETEVLGLVSQGLTDTEISAKLRVSTRTVNAHMRSIFSKLDVPSRAAATRVAVEQGLLPTNS